MDKQTSEKLNDTLEKMGAMGEGNSSADGSAGEESSDMSFYVIMLALIVGMGFCVSYDKEQRYGSDNSTAAKPAVEAEAEPVVVKMEKVKTVEVKPLAEIPATESTPAAVVVEKVEQKTTVTTAVVPVENQAPAAEIKAAPVVVPAPVAPAPVATTESAPAPAAAEAAPTVSSMMMPAMKVAKEAADFVAAPVVDAVETMAETTDTVVAPVAEPVQAYNPYNYQYGQQPQNNYYQQQQYGNPYGYQYGNQYSNPYGNQYGNPYGYGNNPYQQPAAQPAQ